VPQYFFVSKGSCHTNNILHYRVSSIKFSHFEEKEKEIMLIWAWSILKKKKKKIVQAGSPLFPVQPSFEP